MDMDIHEIRATLSESIALIESRRVNAMTKLLVSEAVLDEAQLKTPSKVIGAVTVYHGKEFGFLLPPTTPNVRIIRILKNAAKNDLDDSEYYDIELDSELARRGGVTTDDRVEVQPWIEKAGRFSFVTSDPLAKDLAIFSGKKVEDVVVDANAGVVAEAVDGSVKGEAETYDDQKKQVQASAVRIAKAWGLPDPKPLEDVLFMSLVGVPPRNELKKLAQKLGVPDRWNDLSQEMQATKRYLWFGFGPHGTGRAGLERSVQDLVELGHDLHRLVGRIESAAQRVKSVNPKLAQMVLGRIGDSDIDIFALKLSAEIDAMAGLEEVGSE